MVFKNNDRPGVMLASAVRTYLNRYGVMAGEQAVVFTNNDSAYEVARDLSDAGAQITLVDVRTDAPEEPRAALRKRGIEVLLGHAVISARGRARVRSVDVALLNDRGDDYAGIPRTLPCDLVCMSGGWNPTVHLYSQSRGAAGLRRGEGLFRAR